MRRTRDRIVVFCLIICLLAYCYCFWFVFLVLRCLLRESRVALPGETQQQQEQRYPFLPVSAVLLGVQKMVWLPVFGILNVRTDADACDCTLWL